MIFKIETVAILQIIILLIIDLYTYCSIIIHIYESFF